MPSVTQLTGLLAVHAQPDVVVTPTAPMAPAAGGVRLVGDAVKLHDGAACVTATDFPAMVSVVVRALGVVLVATV